MSKTTQGPSSKKWMGPRAMLREEGAGRKGNTTAPPPPPPPPPPAPPSHDQPAAPPAAAQVPQSLFFERQEAVDALSNLYHNTETTKTIESGAPVVQPRDSAKFHEEFGDVLKEAGKV